MHRAVKESSFIERSMMSDISLIWR
ncbi:hypothetical protein EMIT091MI3_80040 [Kosakonia quasisacchari]